MFAILSGLGHGSVQRLKQTWEKLSTKYHKILKALQLLMDPSRNMMHYRREISTRPAPIIPFYPIVKKDLTFINLAHMTISDDGLVNFDKMRMISKEVRTILNMSSQPYIMPSSAVLSNLNSTSNDNSNSNNSTCTNKNCTFSNKQRNLQAMVSEISGEIPLPPPPPTVCSSNSVAPRRLFEESFMKKKVRHYLENCFSKINYDEDMLLSKSIEIEPGANSNLNQSQHSQSNASIKSQSKDQLSINTGSTTTINSTSNTSTNGNATLNNNTKLQGSPTLSSTSSGSSSCRLKFGAESPHQLRKLMSLCEVDSGKVSNKNHHGLHGLGHFLNYNHNHNHNNHLNNQQYNQQNSLNGRNFNSATHTLPNHPHLAQQLNNNLTQQLGNNFPQSNHLRNLNDSLNCSNNILLNTVSFNGQLSVESSSVTSLRRLEQLQQIKKFQEQQYFFSFNSTPILQQQHSTNNQQQSPVARVPLPNYDEAMRKHKMNTIGRYSNLSNNLSNSNNSSTNSSLNRKNDNDKVSAV